MIALAVILLVLVAAIVLFVIVAGASETVRMEWNDLNLAWEPTALVVFLLGALTLLLVGLALGLIRAGTRRSTEKRRELKRLREADKDRARDHDRADDQRATDARDRRADTDAGNAGNAGDRPVSPPRDNPPHR